METLVVNLFAGPGAGKSSLRAGIFYELKRLSVECEEAYEFAKDLVWEGRDETFKNQLYIFGKQHHRVFRLLDKVEVAITDCPFILGPVYDNHTRPTFEALAVEEHKKMNTFNAFLTRVKKYNPNGRRLAHDEGFARDMDNRILWMLKKHDIPYETFEGNDDGKDAIVRRILAILGKSDI